MSGCASKPFSFVLISIEVHSICLVLWFCKKSSYLAFLCNSVSNLLQSFFSFLYVQFVLIPVYFLMEYFQSQLVDQFLYKQTNKMYESIQMKKEKPRVSESTMFVNQVFESLLNSVKSSNLNFHIQQTPLSTIISNLKKQLMTTKLLTKLLENWKVNLKCSVTNLKKLQETQMTKPKLLKLLPQKTKIWRKTSLETCWTWQFIMLLFYITGIVN